MFFSEYKSRIMCGLFFVCMLLMAHNGLLGQVMVPVKGGIFKPQNTSPQKSNETSVRINDLLVAKNEVSYEDYLKYVHAVWAPEPESFGWGGGMLPVVSISYYDALHYCNWLSEQQGFSPCYRFEQIRSTDLSNYGDTEVHVSCNFSANGYRLPTEAEWEFVASGGTLSKGFVGAGGNVASEIGWHFENAQVRPRPVGLLAANELGIHDMSGNAAELCWEEGPLKPARGGSWNDYAHDLRIVSRMTIEANETGNASVGFRLFRNLNQ